MPIYQPRDNNDPDDPDDDVEGQSPHTFVEGNVSIVRAARVDDRELLGDFGVEQLTAKGGIGAIIHDKLLVIDPLSDNCTVVLGSHNLGFKASYSNDENLVIIQGHKDLAEAYRHSSILRPLPSGRSRPSSAPHKKGWSGSSTPTTAGLTLSRRSKGSLMAYFARGGR